MTATVSVDCHPVHLDGSLRHVNQRLSFVFVFFADEWPRTVRSCDKHIAERERDTGIEETLQFSLIWMVLSTILRDIIMKIVKNNRTLILSNKLLAILAFSF